MMLFGQSRSPLLRKVFASAPSARVFDLFIKLFSPSWREIHHSFILGSETWKRIYDAFSTKKSFSPFAQSVRKRAFGARLRPFFQTLFSELEIRDIIVSFWEVKHGNESMMLFGRSRYLHLRKVFASAPSARVFELFIKLFS
jgi:hypothetical protein